MINPKFKNISRFFVLSFKNGNDDSTKNYFFKYYMQLVEIKDFNVLIDNIIISFSLIRKRFFLSHIDRNRLFRPLTF